MEKLGKLKEVKLRDVWRHEQKDFSTWLAEDENIQQLGDALDITFTDIETEKFVGSFRCDIIGKDEQTGKAVLIENQLEQSNHDHLGKVITYASGLDASIVIWIVEHAREEHSSAIEWLNSHTSDDLSFFLVEIHVYTIGDSKKAPYFKIIEQPNDFSRTTKAIAKSGKLSATEEYRLDFWNKFNDVLEQEGRPFNKRKATHDHWYNVAIGTSSAYLSIDLIDKEHKVRVGLWVPDNKDLFDDLLSKKDEIENAIGFDLIWDRKEGKKASAIFTYIKGLNFKKQDNYPELMKEIVKTATIFRDVFGEYAA